MGRAKKSAAWPGRRPLMAPQGAANKERLPQRRLVPVRPCVGTCPIRPQPPLAAPIPMTRISCIHLLATVYLHVGVGWDIRGGVGIGGGCAFGCAERVGTGESAGCGLGTSHSHPPSHARTNHHDDRCYKACLPCRPQYLHALPTAGAGGASPSAASGGVGKGVWRSLERGGPARTGRVDRAQHGRLDCDGGGRGLWGGGRAVLCPAVIGVCQMAVPRVCYGGGGVACIIPNPSVTPPPPPRGPIMCVRGHLAEPSGRVNRA